MAEEALGGVAYGTIAFVEILIFISTFVIGYIYVWRKGVFNWGLEARAEARQEAKMWAKRRREDASLLKRAA